MDLHDGNGFQQLGSMSDPGWYNSTVTTGVNIGGEGWAGMWSMIIANLNEGEGYSHIQHGNSYMQIISWDEEGNLDPRAIVTYSQSPESDSPHYADMTHMYARGGWLRLPFSDAEITGSRISRSYFIA